MNLRFVLLVGALAVGPGCAQDIQPFLGTYDASGQITFALFGSSASQPREEVLRITEGLSADIVISDGKECALPARVQDSVATLVPNTSCHETRTGPDGTSVAADFVVTRGTATLLGGVITLEYEGTVNSTYQGVPYTASFTSTLNLVRAAP